MQDLAIEPTPFYLTPIDPLVLTIAIWAGIVGPLQSLERFVSNLTPERSRQVDTIVIGTMLAAGPLLLMIPILGAFMPRVITFDRFCTFLNSSYLLFILIKILVVDRLFTVPYEADIGLWFLEIIMSLVIYQNIAWAQGKARLDRDCKQFAVTMAKELVDNHFHTISSDHTIRSLTNTSAASASPSS